MKKEQFFFLLGGFAFGVLVGFGLFKVHSERPLTDSDAGPGLTAAAPAGPRAPGQQAPAAAGGGGAPMVAEINELKRRLEANPQDVTAAATLGGMYYQIGMLDQSLEFYEIAIGILPTDPNLLTDSGNVHRGLGEYANALNRFREAHELDANHWQSLFNTVVVAAFDLGQLELADAAMAKLEQFDPAPDQLPELKLALEAVRTETAP